MAEQLILLSGEERMLSGWRDTKDTYTLNNILYTDQLPLDHERRPQSDLEQSPFYTYGDALIYQLNKSKASGWEFTEEAYEKSKNLTKTLHRLALQYGGTVGLNDSRRLILMDLSSNRDPRSKTYSLCSVSKLQNIGEGWELPLYKVEEYPIDSFESRLAEFAFLNQLRHVEMPNDKGI